MQMSCINWIAQIQNLMLLCLEADAFKVIIKNIVCEKKEEKTEKKRI